MTGYLADSSTRAALVGSYLSERLPDEEHAVGGSRVAESRCRAARSAAAGGVTGVAVGRRVRTLTIVLVTGGAGFIGSHMTAELLRRGHAVRVPDNLSTGSRENLAAVGGEVELIEGAVRSHERIHAAAQGARCVIRLAAPPSVPRCATSMFSGAGRTGLPVQRRDPKVLSQAFDGVPP